MHQNPFFTKKSRLHRQLIGDLITMCRQTVPEGALVVSRISAETASLTWADLLAKFKDACRVQKTTTVVLKGWADLSGRVPQFAFNPAVVLRYSDGRLTPRDTFGRRLAEVFTVLANRPAPGTVAGRESTQAMSLAFRRLHRALEAMSLDLAKQAGKTGRDYPVCTARSHDGVPFAEVWGTAATLEAMGLEAGKRYWFQRHPLVTRGEATVVAKDLPIPLGTLVFNPAFAQEGLSMDVDGDQCDAREVCEGDPDNDGSLVGPLTALDGLAGLAATPLVAWLKAEPKGLGKLRYTGLLKVAAPRFADVVNQLGQYSVAGIGQVGYNPALCMALLDLVGAPEFAGMAAFGYRRLYEDLMLAGMTPERWELFTLIRDLAVPEGVDLVAALQATAQAAGFAFSRAQCRVIVIARAIAKACSALEAGGAVSKTLKGLIGPQHVGYIPLFGLARAVDAGRLNSVFLPNWETILADYDGPVASTLRAICPLMLAATQTLAHRAEQAELRELAAYE